MVKVIAAISNSCKPNINYMIGTRYKAYRSYVCSCCRHSKMSIAREIEKNKQNRIKFMRKTHTKFIKLIGTTETESDNGIWDIAYGEAYHLQSFMWNARFEFRV